MVQFALSALVSVGAKVPQCTSLLQPTLRRSLGTAKAKRWRVSLGKQAVLYLIMPALSLSSDRKIAPLHARVMPDMIRHPAPAAWMPGALTGCVGEPPAQLYGAQPQSGRLPMPRHDVWVDVYTVLGLPLMQISQKACTGGCIPREP